MIKLVAFDWNGTLLADTQATLQAENITLKAIGKDPVSLRKFQEMFDIPIIKYFDNMGFSQEFVKANINVIENTFHEEYKKFSLRSRTRSGVKETLRWIKSRKITSVIYSNHDIPDINRHLNRLGIKNSINEILANAGDEREQVYRRHKAEKLNNFRKSKKIKPSEVISIGDTCEEIEISAGYGYHSVAITGGFNSTARLKSAKPDFLIHNLKSLIPIIKKLNK